MERTISLIYMYLWERRAGREPTNVKLYSLGHFSPQIRFIAPPTKKMVNKQAADDAAAAGDASRVRYSCRDTRDSTGTTHDLDFSFHYEIEVPLDATKVELNRLQVAYVYQLASQLLPCAGDTETNESDPLESSFVITAVDSAADDVILNTGEIFWRLETR